MGACESSCWRGRGRGRQEGDQMMVDEGKIAVQAGKEAVHVGGSKCRMDSTRVPKPPLYSVRAFIGRGSRLEQRLFHPLFATNEQEAGARSDHWNSSSMLGMGAFVEKRKATFTNTSGQLKHGN